MKRSHHARSTVASPRVATVAPACVVCPGRVGRFAVTLVRSIEANDDAAANFRAISGRRHVYEINPDFSDGTNITVYMYTPIDARKRHSAARGGHARAPAPPVDARELARHGAARVDRSRAARARVDGRVCVTRRWVVGRARRVSSTRGRSIARDRRRRRAPRGYTIFKVCARPKISIAWRERRYRSARRWRAALKAAAPSAASVGALDEISDEVCRVVDVAEVCRHTHPSREYVIAAEKAYVRLQDYVASLNADGDLYEALRSARERDAKNLSDEGARVALTLQEDFERGGIHLDPARRTGFRRELVAKS